MKLRDADREEPEINLAPLLDVVFLLLIFFMVTTTFERQARLRVELPEAAAEPSQISEDALELVISEDGRYYVNSNEVINTRFDTLKDAILQAAGENRDQPVTIRADARTPHQAVVTAMDAISQLGFVNLSIATTPREDS